METVTPYFHKLNTVILITVHTLSAIATAIVAARILYRLWRITWCQ